jgi:hypothetical protein
MNEKKNLDRLFQEKFKDFEAAPPEFVWENIQEALQEKKKRRVIPLWFRLAGVAALLVLGGLLFTLFFNDAENGINTNNPVVIDNTTATPSDAVKTAPDNMPEQSGPSAAGTNNAKQNTTGNSNTAVALGEENTNTTTTANGQNNGASSASGKPGITTINTLPSAVNNNNAIANSDNNYNNTINKNNGKRIKQNKVGLQQGNAVAATQQAIIAPVNNNTPALNNNNQNAVADFQQKTTPQNNNVVKTTNNPTDTNRIANTQQANEGIASNEAAIDNNNAVTSKQQNITNSTNTTPAVADNNAATSSAKNSVDNSNGNASQKSNTIIDKNIPATEAVAQTTVDSTTVVPENELEKLLREKLSGEKEEDKAVAETKHKDRWNIKPQVAPVFYNSLSNGSPINEQFANNSKSYDNDLSYGLGINYAVNDRISIRSGINSVNLNYATNNIAYYASLNSSTTNIGESKTANIVVQNPGDGVPDTFLIDGQPNQLVSGSMVQKTGYIEVPLEMSYALVNNKFGIDVIGGVSTLFLNQNNVSVVSSAGLSTKVGEAANLNDIHFSTNVGVGFKYRFWDAFQANFEPMFKYQVNAYSKDAGNFKPYFIGLYTGISFSF